ncbi:MAG: pyruvate kinase, partial [Chloroflexi bacterium]|nr:pyruvate kinase [Chloroflexota bacterium]
ADQLDASLIVAFTESGSTASRVSRYRPNSPILALTPYEHVSRLLTLRWGVMPAVVKKLETGDDIFGAGLEQARKTPGVEPGGTIVLVAGLPMGTQGSTNLLHIMEVD